MYIVTIITCHNRKAKTLACLNALFQSTMPTGCSLHVILVDDGSSDSTSDAVRELYPTVEILHGDGNLYWNGGMRVAFAKAMNGKFDFYLWLNDDTTLFTYAISILLEAQERMKAETGRYGITVGSTCEEDGRLSYGGLLRKANSTLLHFERIVPSEEPQSCTTMNGNCVLISAAAVDKLGNLDKHFIHTMGDVDYGLRAERARIPVWLVPRFAGKCAHDHKMEGSYLDGTLSIKNRLKLVSSVKNFPPKAWWVFCFRHAGSLAPVLWIWPYVKAIIVAKK